MEPALGYGIVLGIDPGLQNGFLSENMMDINGMVALKN
jgi:hypothetical protein